MALNANETGPVGEVGTVAVIVKCPRHFAIPVFRRNPRQRRPIDRRREGSSMEEVERGVSKDGKCGN